MSIQNTDSTPDVRRATEQDIEDVCRWLQAKGGKVPPRDMFSSLGYACPGLAYLGLYLTDSSIAHVEMLVGNPAVHKAVRSAALDAVIVRTMQEAHAAGVRVMQALVDQEFIEARLVRLGFVVLSRQVTFLAANLVDPAANQDVYGPERL